MKKIWMILIALLFAFSLAACEQEATVVQIPTEPDETETAAEDFGELVILFTGGLEGVYDRDEAQGSLGYAALRAYVKSLEAENRQVLLIDGGCSVDVPGDDGVWDVVNACGYDLRVPGIVELASGVDALVDRTEELTACTYLSCNLIRLADQSTVFEPYALVELDGIQVGVVGVTDPQALTTQDADSYGILGSDDKLALYEAVQKAVDDASDAGAAYVIVVGNLGTAVGDSPLTTVEVISDITGMAVWLDCGSGSVLDGDTVRDQDDFEIPVCAPGHDFRYIGQVTLNLNDGSAEVELITDLEAEDRTVQNLVQKLNDAD